FSDNTTAIINNGKNGANGNDGNTPKVEIKDGYWWINDTNTGEKATGDDGKTPKFRIENGELQYSFNGKDWTSLGNIKGEPGMQGDSIFKENGVTVEGDHVIFTLTKALADGRETIELPLYSSALRFDSYETVNVTT